SAPEAVAEGGADHPRQVELPLGPFRERIPEHGESGRCVAGERVEKPLELDERLLVEHHHVEILCSDAGRRQAVLDGTGRKVGILLLPGEALLMGRGHDRSVTEQSRGGVVEERGDPQDIRAHPATPWPEYMPSSTVWAAFSPLLKASSVQW